MGKCELKHQNHKSMVKHVCFELRCKLLFMFCVGSVHTNLYNCISMPVFEKDAGEFIV